MLNQGNFPACRVFCTSQKRAAPNFLDQYPPITIPSLLCIVVRCAKSNTSSLAVGVDHMSFFSALQAARRTGMTPATWTVWLRL